MSGLTCWENYMPLARAALYAQEVDVYLAPTWDNSDVWVPTLRHIAREGGAFVVGVNFCMRGTDVPAGLPGRDDLYGADDDWLARGNTAIIGPEGDILAGPLVGEEGIVTAELELARARAARQQFGAAGLHARPDLFRLTVQNDAHPAVTFEAPSAP
jgi:nitrilase